MPDALEYAVEYECQPVVCAEACDNQADDLERAADCKKSFVVALVERTAAECAEEVDEEDVDAADPCDFAGWSIQVDFVARLEYAKGLDEAEGVEHDEEVCGYISGVVENMGGMDTY